MKSVLKFLLLRAESVHFFRVRDLFLRKGLVFAFLCVQAYSHCYAGFKDGQSDEESEWVKVSEDLSNEAQTEVLEASFDIVSQGTLSEHSSDLFDVQSIPEDSGSPRVLTDEFEEETSSFEEDEGILVRAVSLESLLDFFDRKKKAEKAKSIISQWEDAIQNESGYDLSQPNILDVIELCSDEYEDLMFGHYKLIEFCLIQENHAISEPIRKRLEESLIEVNKYLYLSNDSIDILFIFNINY